MLHPADALKTHRRDQFIEWLKGLLATPFVLLSQPTAIHEDDSATVDAMATNAHARYSQVMTDVEGLIRDHIEHDRQQRLQTPTTQGGPPRTASRLKLLVPSIGTFFTPLPLRRAFEHQDLQRRISSRRFVAPSFNDVRLILNTAQAMALVASRALQLVTFDGDVTLYDDGASLAPENPCISRILALLERGVAVAIVTAAGYAHAEGYYRRLSGLLERLARAEDEGKGSFEHRLVVMGGESNFLFAYSRRAEWSLEKVEPERWQLPEMRAWTEEDVQALLDVAEAALRDCVDRMALPVHVLRKERAVGIYPPVGTKLLREQLEETVLVTQRRVETSEAGRRVPFCAFNGGNDVFVDIGDKSWGVRACQAYFGGIDAASSLHVGDQFLSAGANDFKARQAACTAWIASPAETVSLLDEILELEMGDAMGEGR